MTYSKEAADTIQEKFADSVLERIEFRGEITLMIKPESLLEIAQYLRDTDGLEFNMLTDVAGADYYPDEPRFGISYVLFSLSDNVRLRLKLRIEEDVEIDSMTGLYPGANWMEREIFDMFGVRFKNHPDMRRILMPFDWTGHPQRKDYPLGYEEVQFTFNYDRVQSKKPQPKE